MKIIEANIIQFGKFKDAKFTFEDGLNVVRGDNESGKSTLLGFIKFALYGVGRKNPNVTVGERERALSWNVGIAAGSLTVEDADGKRYRIERNGREGARGAYSDKVRIIDLNSGEEDFFGEVPGEHFLGISSQAYDSMCNIKQLETVAVGADAVKGVIDNLLSSGDENTNIAQAEKTLDAERRRLLHTNGKGGLIYESRLALERLRSEHKNAIIHENDLAKYTDELERVEEAITRAREAHGAAQRMCDLHDDAVRVQKFDKLNKLRALRTELEQKSKKLNESAGFDVTKASYETLARLDASADSLKRSKSARNSVRNELRNAEIAFEEAGVVYSEGMSELLEEFGSPRSAQAHYLSKQKKKRTSLSLLIAFAVLGVALLALAGALALAMNNFSGALTVGFIAIVALGAAFAFYNRFVSSKRETDEFISHFGEEGGVDADEILARLERFSHSRESSVQKKSALDSARVRFAMAEEGLLSVLDEANELLVGYKEKHESEEEALLSYAEKMKDYLVQRADIEDEKRNVDALISSLCAELERFNEKDVRARITPEILEKISETSFEKLKAERDAALQHTNQLGQYKAGIERNLASSTQRRGACEIYPEIEAEQERLSTLELRLDAIRLAAEAIAGASQNMKNDVTPRIRENAQKNLSSITEGKYDELFVGENMEISIFADGATRHIDSLSRGSLDVAYFAVRLGLLETLLKDRKPPVFMDETLSQLDDKRAENTLRTIAKYAEKNQCVLFTCQHRDVNLAKRVTEINLIEL